MNWDTLVGLPWKDRGRGPDGYDCWGLLRKAFEDGRNVVVPSFDEKYETSDDKTKVGQAIDEGLVDWLSVMPGAEQPFDGVLMRIEGNWHIGIVTRPGSMLHMPHEGTSVIEPYRTARYAAALRRGGFYRYGVQ